MGRIERIGEVEDPRLEVYRHLKDTNATRWLRRFVVEGMKLVERLLASRYPVESVVCLERHVARVEERLGAGSEVPVYVVEPRLATELVGYNFHQGALAAGERLAGPGLARFLEELPAVASLIGLPRCDNPENLGTLIRLADVFGVGGLVVGRCCPDPLSRRVLRVSMGAALGVPVVVVDDPVEALGKMREAGGFRLYAAEARGDAEDFARVSLGPRTVWVFGRESAGLAPEVSALCDARVTIPMRPGADSLNLASSASILLQHDYRVRMRRG
jgi:tRNA G18 (ribose-2'-O)-methylase SpoU